MKSLYFAACQKDDLFYLDPHTVQPFKPVTLLHQVSSQFHCQSIKSMSISELDPSMVLGFLVMPHEWNDFKSKLTVSGCVVFHARLL